MPPTDMTAVYEARRRNLIELIARHDKDGRGVAALARKLGYSWPGFVSQMRSQPDATGHRTMTEATARAIEAALGLPVGCMDAYPLPGAGAKRRVTASANRLIVLLADAADRAGVHLPADKLAAAVQAMEAAGRSDPAYADIVVALLR